jgi:hypothetical protein
MKKFLILFLFLCFIFTGFSQKLNKQRDCFKLYEVSDTTIKSIVWKDSTNVLKWTTGLEIVQGRRYTCVDGYDSIYLIKYIVYDKDFFYIKPEDIFFMENLKKE